jgi:hypothetical protein
MISGLRGISNRPPAEAPTGGGDDEATVSCEWLAGVSGYTSREIQRFVASGEVPKPTKGRYSMEGSLRGIFAHIRKQNAKTSPEKQLATLRKEEAQADIAELDLAERIGELRDAAIVDMSWDDAIIRVVDVVRRLPITEPQKKKAIDEIREIIPSIEAGQESEA